jgi:hypothetical protein
MLAPWPSVLLVATRQTYPPAMTTQAKPSRAVSGQSRDAVSIFGTGPCKCATSSLEWRFTQPQNAP